MALKCVDVSSQTHRFKTERLFFKTTFPLFKDFSIEIVAFIYLQYKQLYLNTYPQLFDVKLTVIKPPASGTI